MASRGLDILGGLATVGAGAGTGILSGLVEGETLKRTFASQDIFNQLNALRALQAQQSLTEPKVISLGGGRVWIKRPGQPGEIQQAPMSPQESAALKAHEAAAKASEATAKWRETQAGQAPHTTLDQQRGKLVQDYLQALGRGDMKEAQRILDALKGVTGATHVDPKATSPHVSTHYATDAQGNVTAIVTRTDPMTGKTTTERIPQGPIGRREKPERAPRAWETTSAITINDQNRAQFQSSVNDVRNQLTSLGVLKDDQLPYVLRKDGKRELKTEVLEKAYAIAHPGMRVTITWNPGTKQFEIVRAWEVRERREVPAEATEE